jgi:hypothetical protein
MCNNDGDKQSEMKQCVEEELKVREEYCSDKEKSYCGNTKRKKSFGRKELSEKNPENKNTRYTNRRTPYDRALPHSLSFLS